MEASLQEQMQKSCIKMAWKVPDLLVFKLLSFKSLQFTGKRDSSSLDDIFLKQLQSTYQDYFTRNC
mgnify:FL=1